MYYKDQSLQKHKFDFVHSPAVLKKKGYISVTIPENL